MVSFRYWGALADAHESLSCIPPKQTRIVAPIRRLVRGKLCELEPSSSVESGAFLTHLD